MNDRIIVWIDKSLVQFGIVKYLQDKYDCELYALIDVTNRTKTFFQNQTLAKFHKTWFYHDHIKVNKKPDVNYLKSIEDKYGINLWLLAYNERVFYEFHGYRKFTDDEVLSILEDECRLFEKILDDVDPNFIILNQPALHHNYLFYKICKSRGINILLLKTTRIGYKCIITDEDEVLDYKGKTSILTKRTFNELQEYLTTFSIYKQAMEFGNKFQKSKLNLLRAAIQFLFISNNSNIKTHYTYFGRTKFKVLLKSFIYSLKTKYRKNFIDRNLVKHVNLDVPFIYFPLHIEQERSLLILAPFYINQLEVITSLVKSLPVGYNLYVKEHPTMFSREWRPISIYKKIMSLPNVTLIHPSVNPTDLMKKCKLLITISGTNGLDAAFYQKPSIVFTDTAFSTLPSVHRLKSIEDLPNVIKSSLQKEVEVSDVNEYVNFIDEISFNFDFDGFVQVIQDYFHYGGSLIDVEIQPDKMKFFLELHKTEFEHLSSEFIKKIKNYKT